MDNLNDSFLVAISQAFKAYNKFGARSNKKLVPIHKWLADLILSKLGPEYSIMSLDNSKEAKLEGKYYPKDLDIAVLRKEKIITTISFKFVTSNYKQNSNNYFENLLGETANIRRVNVGFAHFLVLRAHTPYYDKNFGNKRGKQKKIEVINEKDLLKYVKLFQDQDFPHKPEVLGIAVVDFNNKGQARFISLNELKISQGIQKVIDDSLSLDNFTKKFVALCQLKS